MLRSRKIDDSTEFDLIKDKKHVEKVWGVISKNLDSYYASMISPVGELAQHELAKKFKVTSVKETNGALRDLYSNALSVYEKDRVPYKDLFNSEVMKEFLDDDPKAFKQFLKKECPIIRSLVNSQREELKEWKMKFNNTSGDELFAIFQNLVTFTNKYSKDYDAKKYLTYDDWKTFELTVMEEDEKYIVEGVIGMGIKSIVLYNLFAEMFSLRVGRPLYALYFLSNQEYFDLPSRISEFLMIDDRRKSDDQNLKMNHNYWYPYGLFTLFALRIFKYLQLKAKDAGLQLDIEKKYVYVNVFLEHVAVQHEKDIDTMMTRDEV